jgi:hypothetical protein
MDEKTGHCRVIRLTDACFLQAFITCTSIDFFSSKIILSFYRACPPDSKGIIAASLDPVKAGLKEIYSLSLIIEFSDGIGRICT